MGHSKKSKIKIMSLTEHFCKKGSLKNCFYKILAFFDIMPYPALHFCWNIFTSVKKIYHPLSQLTNIVYGCPQYNSTKRFHNKFVIQILSPLRRIIQRVDVTVKFLILIYFCLLIAYNIYSILVLVKLFGIVKDH